MKLEKKVNEYGQEQRIRNSDKIIKIGDKFLQVRLIETQKWRDRKKFTPPMPRARFVNVNEKNPYYLVRKSDVLELKGRKK